MSPETRDTKLHGQLQKGLKQEIMSASTVSGAQKHKQLCLAAKNEERLAELRKRKQYCTSPMPRKDDTTAKRSEQQRQQRPSGTSLRTTLVPRRSGEGVKEKNTWYTMFCACV